MQQLRVREQLHALWNFRCRPHASKVDEPPCCSSSAEARLALDRRLRACQRMATKNIVSRSYHFAIAILAQGRQGDGPEYMSNRYTRTVGGRVSTEMRCQLDVVVFPRLFSYSVRAVPCTL